jgi:hypothetical protein
MDRFSARQGTCGDFSGNRSLARLCDAELWRSPAPSCRSIQFFLIMLPIIPLPAGRAATLFPFVLYLRGLPRSTFRLEALVSFLEFGLAV